MSGILGLRGDTAAAVALKLVVIVQRFPDLAKDPTRLSRLARVMARNLDASEARHRDVVRRGLQKLSKKPAPTPPAMPDATLQSAVDRAIALLGENERLLLQFRIVNEMTLTQIAEITGTYPSAVHRSLARALDTLRKTLISYAESNPELRDALRARGIIP